MKTKIIKISTNLYKRVWQFSSWIGHHYYTAVGKVLETMLDIQCTFKLRKFMAVKAVELWGTREFLKTCSQQQRKSTEPSEINHLTESIIAHLIDILILLTIV